MTNGEAIERIKCILKNNSFTKADKNALKLTIEALEKQIPKKPIQANYIVRVNGVDTLLDENEFTKCPSCTYKDTEVKHGQKYCHICGQALDWSDAELTEEKQS